MYGWYTRGGIERFLRERRYEKRRGPREYVDEGGGRERKDGGESGEVYL